MEKRIDVEFKFRILRAPALRLKGPRRFSPGPGGAARGGWVCRKDEMGGGGGRRAPLCVCAVHHRIIAEFNSRSGLHEI